VSKHFVLIHGAWHGGWCWDGVIKALNKIGHTAEAPTMPGHHPEDDRTSISLDSYVNKIVEVLRRQIQPVILVGHSSAGFLLQSAAPKAFEKIERLIFHNACILADGMAQFDIVPPEMAEAMTAAAGISSDNSVPVLEDLVRGALMAGEPIELQDALLKRLTPQPLALFTTKVSTTAFQKLTTPRTVLLCKDDRVLPVEVYLEMAKNLGEFDLVEIEGGHETLFLNAEALAQALAKAAI
jgi:pimeloyl-ACP methyl ester carboxylesterase